MKTSAGKAIFFVTALVLLPLLAGLPLAYADEREGIKLTPGQQLLIGQTIAYLNGELLLQSDGSLVYSVDMDDYWTTGTEGKAVTHAIMQQDGNLVLYNNATKVWASDTAGALGAYLYCDLVTRTAGIYTPAGTLIKPLTEAAPATLIGEPATERKGLLRTAPERLQFEKDVKAAYAAGEAVRALSTALNVSYGQSIRAVAANMNLNYGLIERVLIDAGIAFPEIQGANAVP